MRNSSLPLKDDVTNYKEIAILMPRAKALGQPSPPLSTSSDSGRRQGGNDWYRFRRHWRRLPDERGRASLCATRHSHSLCTAQNQEVEVLRGRSTTVDFKMRYASKEETGETRPTTTRWVHGTMKLLPAEGRRAAAPHSDTVVGCLRYRCSHRGRRRAQLPLRCACRSPDGVKGSEIAWSDYQSVPTTQSTTVAIDRAVIKPNETFKVYYEDVMADAAKSWAIIDPATNTPMATAKNATSITAKIAKVGVYDLTCRYSRRQDHRQPRLHPEVTPESRCCTYNRRHITTNATGLLSRTPKCSTFTGRKGARVSCL